MKIMETLDMQGQPCPIPVVKAKEVLAGQDAEGVVVVVDNFVAVQNLEKMAKGTGCGFSYAEEGALYRATVIKRPGSGPFSGGQPAEAEGKPSKAPEAAGGAGKGPVVLVTADSMGRGAEELGRMLIKGFVFSLTQLNPLPEAVIFLNGGARLTTEGANTVPDLKTLEEKGVGVYTCGTCANYYKLTEALAVGSIVDMMNIVTRLGKAASIITI
ncbi:MAG: sulfurtransferase-like selenium metabolism protein YedF [Spirochaetaceae bacterium]|jgi:selenium metabolism protein YedF|nr:sulfurtransferase-like selenium metabolism protein YedF [Spirochaetaceae bacterium]